MNYRKSPDNYKDWLKQAYSSLTLESTFSQNNVDAFETTSANYNLLNFALGGDFYMKNIKFSTSLSINNLLNKTYINHLSRLKNDGIFNQGRNIVLGVNFTI